MANSINPNQVPELSDTYKQVLENAIYLPPNVQRTLLGWYTSAIKREYLRVFPDDPNLENYQNVMLGNQWQPQRGSIMQNALNTPFTSPTGYEGSTLVPDIRNIGDLGNVLTRSFIPAAAQFALNKLQSVQNATSALPQLLPQVVDIVQEQLANITARMAAFNPSIQKDPIRYITKFAMGDVTSVARKEQAVAGQVSLESLNPDTLFGEPGFSEQDPTELPFMEYVPKGRGQPEGFRFNYIYTLGGKPVLNTQPGFPSYINTSEFQQEPNIFGVQENRVPTGYKNLFMSASELNTLSPVLRGQQPIPSGDTNLRKLYNAIWQGVREIDESGIDRSTDTVMYTMDRTRAVRDLQQNAIGRLPNRMDVGLWIEGKRDYRYTIDPSRVLTHPTETSQPLLFSHQDFAHWLNYSSEKNRTAEGNLLNKRATDIIRQFTFSPPPPVNPENADINPYLLEDQAFTQSKGLANERPPEEREISIPTNYPRSLSTPTSRRSQDERMEVQQEISFVLEESKGRELYPWEKARLRILYKHLSQLPGSLPPVSKGTMLTTIAPEPDLQDIVVKNRTTTEIYQGALLKKSDIDAGLFESDSYYVDKQGNYRYGQPVYNTGYKRTNLGRIDPMPNGENLQDYNYTPAGEPIRDLKNPTLEELQLNEGTYVEGVDYAPRPATAVGRSMAIDEEAIVEGTLLAGAANKNPSQRQAVKNLLSPKGAVGNYRDDLPEEERTQEMVNKDFGYWQDERAKYIRRYEKKYGLEEAIKRADAKIAERIAKNLANKRNARQLKADALLNRLSPVAASQTVTARSEPPDNFDSQADDYYRFAPEPIEEEPADIAQAQKKPFYARANKTDAEVAKLAQTLGKSPELVRKAIQVLVEEYPEYIEKHLGKNANNKEAFEAWVDSLPEDKKARFLENWDIAKKDQYDFSKGYYREEPGRIGAMDIMLGITGKVREERAPKAISPRYANIASRSQEPNWVGTIDEGKIYLNPNVTLKTVEQVYNEFIAEGNQSPLSLVKTLSTRSSAVIAHEAGHLRLSDLSPELRKQFIEIYEEEKKSGSLLASSLDTDGASPEEEFAQQNMLFQMGGNKDRRWKNFQRKHFGRFSEFFESIKDNPAMHKAYLVIKARPKELGPLSQTNNIFSSDEINSLMNGLIDENIGVNALKGYDENQLAEFANKIGVDIDKLKRYVSTIATPQTPPAPPNFAPGNTSTAPRSTTNTATPSSTTTPPINQTGAAPAPTTRSATPGSQVSNQPADWVGNVASERAAWNAMGQAGQSTFQNEQHGFHIQGFMPQDRF